MKGNDHLYDRVTRVEQQNIDDVWKPERP